MIIQGSSMFPKSNSIANNVNVNTINVIVDDKRILVHTHLKMTVAVN